MEQQKKEMKEFLDDLTTRDQRMMFAVLTMVHTADSKEQLLFLFDCRFHQFVIGVGGMKDQLFRHKELGLYPRPYKFLSRHSVVFHKAESRKRGSSQNAHPRYG